MPLTRLRGAVRAVFRFKLKDSKNLCILKVTAPHGPARLRGPRPIHARSTHQARREGPLRDSAARRRPAPPRRPESTAQPPRSSTARERGQKEKGGAVQMWPWPGAADGRRSGSGIGRGSSVGPRARRTSCRARRYAPKGRARPPRATSPSRDMLASVWAGGPACALAVKAREGAVGRSCRRGKRGWFGSYGQSFSARDRPSTKRTRPTAAGREALDGARPLAARQRRARRAAPDLSVQPPRTRHGAHFAHAARRPDRRRSRSRAPPHFRSAFRRGKCSLLRRSRNSRAAGFPSGELVPPPPPFKN